MGEGRGLLQSLSLHRRLLNEDRTPMKRKLFQPLQSQAMHSVSLVLIRIDFSDLGNLKMEIRWAELVNKSGRCQVQSVFQMTKDSLYDCILNIPNLHKGQVLLECYLEF